MKTYPCGKLAPFFLRFSRSRSKGFLGFLEKYIMLGD
jgi:hypothetical protein